MNNRRKAYKGECRVFYKGDQIAFFNYTNRTDRNVKTENALKKIKKIEGVVYIHLRPEVESIY